MSTLVGRDPFAFGEKLLNLLDEGSFTATYKYAVLLGLIDLCMEHSSSDGSAPATVTTQDLARKVLEIYWPQTSPFVARDQAKVLAQNTKGQAEILRLITRFRERHAPDPSAPLSQARMHAKDRFEQLVRDVEWKLVEMPLPRLQTVGTSDDPFLYRIGWTREVKRADFMSGRFDNRIRFVEGSGDYFVQLAGLLRPLVQRQWARMVSRLNEDVIQDARLEEFLFGATRISLDEVRQPLREFQQNRCFYCEAPIRGPAEVDHFIPWVRHPDNGIENLVADARCNNDKRDFVASTEHLQHWRAAHFDPGGRPVEALEQISSTLGWETHPHQTLSVARSIYLRLPEGAKLWDHGKEFAGLNREVVRAAFSLAPCGSYAPP